MLRLVPIHLDKPDTYNNTRRGSEFVPKYDNIQVLLLLALQSISVYNTNNNDDFFCANILEDQAQWRDKTKGLSKLVIVKQCVSRQWMDEEDRRLRKIDSIKEIGF